MASLEPSNLIGVAHRPVPQLVNNKTGSYQPRSLTKPVLASYLIVMLISIGSLGLIVSLDSGYIESNICAGSAGVPACSGGPINDSQLLLNTDFNAVNYFLVALLPKIVTVLLQSCWDVTYARMKTMEPFYALSSARGATAEQLFFGSLQLKGGSFVLRLTTAVHIAFALLVLMTSEAFVVVTTDTCSNDGGPPQPCDPGFELRHGVADMVMALLVVVTVTICIIAVQNHKRNKRIHISQNPSSIMAVANILRSGNQDFVNELRRVHPTASEKDVCQLLNGKTYRLGYHYPSPGRQQFGIYRITSTDTNQVPTSAPYHAIPNPALPLSTSQSRSSLLLKRRIHAFTACLVLIPTIILFSLILTYRAIDQSASSFNAFMNSSSFGPRILLSGLAICVSLGVKRVEYHARVTEVWYRMIRCPQPATRSISLSVAASPWSALLSSMRRDRWDWYTSILAAAAVLSEVLLITGSGIPFATTQTAGSYETCTFMSLALLAFTVGVLVVVMVRIGRHPALPRIPDTLGNIMIYLCGGNLLLSTAESVFGRPIMQGISQGSESNHENGAEYVFEETKDAGGVSKWCVNITYLVASRREVARVAETSDEMMLQPMREDKNRTEMRYSIV